MSPLYNFILFCITKSFATDPDHRSISNENGQFVEIEVTACDGWDYGSSANSLHIQLKGEYDASPFFFVNECGSLPTRGRTEIFNARDYFHDIGGSLFSIVLAMDDSYGYCIRRLAIRSHDGLYGYHEFGYEYFGMGLILSKYCKYSYRSLSPHRSMVRCYDDYLELYTYRIRGVYKLFLHSCVQKNNDISAKDMVDNVYNVVMGKRYPTNVYTTTDIDYLDHYAVGNVNLDRLGHLIGTNILLSDHSTMSDALFSRNVEGKIIGIKLESVGYDMHNIPDIIHNKIRIIIDGDHRDFWRCSTLQMGKFAVLFLRHKDRVKVKKSTAIRIHGDIGHHLYVNVYVIFEGFDRQYQLPFVLQDVGSGDEQSNDAYDENDDKHTNYHGVNWFDANWKCIEKYGTELISIHSKDENILIQGFLGDDESAWIGYIDFDINDMRYYMHHNYGDHGFHDNNFHHGDDSNSGYKWDWMWADGSFNEFSDWQHGAPSHKDGEDCAFIDKKGGWMNGDCERKDKLFYVCASPYWYSNSNRKFEINVRDHIDELALISIGNDHKEISICIDSLTLNYLVPIDMTNHWIGGHSDDPSLRAIFKAPVCRTEIIEMSIDYQTASSTYLTDTTHIPGYFCQNSARFGKAKCAIDIPGGVTRKSNFRLSHHGHNLQHVSFASVSGVTLTTQQTASIFTTNELIFDKKFTIFYTDTLENGTNVINKVKAAVLKPEQYFSDMYENFDHSDEDFLFNEQQYEFRTVLLIHCVGLATVPPAHILPYDVFRNVIALTVNVSADLRLTLCPDFINAAQDNDDTHRIYLKDVAAQIYNFESTGCSVKWGAPQYIHNNVTTGTTCAQEQQLSISHEENYLPLCTEDDPDLYDGCQCKLGDGCWCVDPHGNKIGGKAMFITYEDISWQELCVNVLKCENSNVTIPLD